MINLSTPSDELMKIIRIEHNKALYWLKRHYGGDAGYEKMRDKLLRDCVAASGNLASDVVEYNSKDGNKWLCFEYARYYPESFGSHCMPYAFCYYNTIGSVGAFVPGFSRDTEVKDPVSCTIYTPHFFQRFAERKGVALGSEELVKAFVESIAQVMVRTYDEESNGRCKLDVRLPDGIGRGIRREGKEDVYEVRTFLTDKQLSRKQSKDTEDVRELGDELPFEPTDMLEQRIKLAYNPKQSFQDEVDKRKRLGFDVSGINDTHMLYQTITFLFEDMGVAEQWDLEFWKRHEQNAAKSLKFFKKRMADGGEDFFFIKEFVNLAKEIAIQDGIRKFDKRKFANMFISKLFHWNEEKTQETVKMLFP